MTCHGWTTHNYPPLMKGSSTCCTSETTAAEMYHYYCKPYYDHHGRARKSARHTITVQILFQYSSPLMQQQTTVRHQDLQRWIFLFCGRLDHQGYWFILLPLDCFHCDAIKNQDATRKEKAVFPM
jgi:hypothetical protein